MIRSVLVVAALLTGCGWQTPFDEEATCQSAGITFHLQKKRDCSYYEDLARSARSLLVDQNHYVPAERYDKDFRVDVWVHDANAGIVCQGSVGQVGCYFDPGIIETNRDGSTLAHELLHHWCWLLNRPSRNHEGWWTEAGDAGAAPWKVDGQMAYPGSWYDTTEKFMFEWDRKYESFFNR